MDPYLLLVFFHVLGAVAFFATLGIEVVALHRLRAAPTVAEARTWLPVLQRPGGPTGHLSMLTILVTGIWMMALRWGSEAWMLSSLAAIAGIIAVAVVLRAPLARLAAALNGEAAGVWRQAAHAPGLSASLWLRVALAVGILGLMTIKPGLTGSLVMLAAAVLVSVALTGLVRERAPRPT